MERCKILGPPGTGKTNRLMDIVNDYLERGYRPSEIIFTSFTRAACNEAMDRARLRFGGSRSDYPWFNTEHSICFRLLGLKREQVFTRRRVVEFGRKYNYEFSSDSDNDSLEARYQESMLKTVADHYEFFISYMENRMAPFETAYRDFCRNSSLPDRFTKRGLEVYIDRRNRYKQENCLWSFGDMIIGAIQNRLFPEGARVLIFDEAQDSSKLLWELARFWASQVEDYYIAGDPLQTLYFWSGSDPELFYQFPGEEESLNKTYRFGPAVKDYAIQVVKRTGFPIPDFAPADKISVVDKKGFFSVDWFNARDSFLLIRTRWLISQAVDYFISKGIPFISERGKQSPLATNVGRAYHTLIRLAKEKEVSDIELRNLVKYTRMPFLERGVKTRVKQLMEGIYERRDLQELGFTSDFFNSLFDNTGSILNLKVEEWEKQYLHKVYSNLGEEVFDRDDYPVVTTLHGSKGRQKRHVYIMPDVTRTVWEGYMRDRVPETLLYYVGCTRCQDSLTILLPQSDLSFPLPPPV